MICSGEGYDKECSEMKESKNCDLDRNKEDGKENMIEDEMSSTIDISAGNKDEKENIKVEDKLSIVFSSVIPCVSANGQNDELKGLGVCVYDQTEFESGVINQIDKALQKQEEERRKCAEKVLLEELRSVEQRLKHIEKSLAIVPSNTEGMSREAKRQVEAIKREKDKKLKQLKILNAKMKALHCSVDDAVAIDIMAEDLERIDDDMANDDDESLLRLKKLVTERENDHLIQTGQMTPFGTIAPSIDQFHNQQTRSIKIPTELTDFEKYLLTEAESHQNKKNVRPVIRRNQSTTVSCTSTSDMPSGSTCNSENFPDRISTANKAEIKLNSTPLQPFLRKTKKRRRKIKLGARYATGIKKKRRMFPSMNIHYKSDSEISDFENNDDAYDNLEQDVSDSDDDYFPEQEELESDNDDKDTLKVKLNKKEKTKDDVPWIEVAKEKEIIAKHKAESRKFRFKRISDDGSYTAYMKRMKEYKKKCYTEKCEKLNEENHETDDEEEIEFDGGFRMPMKIWNKLYRYQQTGVRWLWELHQQNCGGIIGDEMGLGKTIQIIAFLAGLHLSKLQTDGDRFVGLGPVVLVCPATVMHQWVREFHLWFPILRIVVLHVTGSFSGTKESLIRQVNDECGVIITSYAGIAIYQTLLLAYEWHYIILDEGHKIRNPDAKVTIACKQFRTCHRLILSGSPIQNNLKELWSLFDFVYPGKLGTLPVFMQQFAVPITHGGYSNASQVQVQTAYKCATILRDTIKPYLLRRMKLDVKMTINLPEKNEQVLFCRLTEEQREIYKQYLSTAEAVNVINGAIQIFVGLISLRKICNHPDIFTGGPRIFKNTDTSTMSDEMKYGYYKRSGKMLVVEVLLRLWHKQGHKVLLFTQSKQMLQILKDFVEINCYNYVSMDGTTSISSRQPLIAKFNNDPNIFVFLLTTRVGGLGVNLTGANRVIIYDPDWNPSTDTQARERAWRIGQDKQVTVYRLLTSGTIEEKIYHRQIFKQVLTNRILKDPRQRRFFKTNHLHELFTLGDADKEGTETSAIFAGTGSEVKLSPRSRESHTPKSTPKKHSDPQNVSFSSEKIMKMKELAKQLSLKLGHNSKSSNCSSIDNSTDNAANSSCKLVLQDSKSSSPIPARNKQKEDINIKNSDQQMVIQKLESKNWKKKQRKKKGDIFEGEHVKYLVKQDVYQPLNIEEDAEQNMKQDEYVLQKLFKKTGIYTALKHDAIMDSSDPDYLLVEGEAKRVAKEAIKALKKSRRQCMRPETGVPTWTGSHGMPMPRAPVVARKRFGQKKRNIEPSMQNSEESLPGCSGYKSGFKEISTLSSSPSAEASDSINEKITIISSSDILSRIKQRNEVISTVPHERRDEPEIDTEETRRATEHDELLVEMRNFIAFQASVDGEATTKELLGAFKEKVPAKSTAVFKELLNQICMFHRLADGNGVWQLKPEFR